MKKLVCHCQSIEADINITNLEKVIQRNPEFEYIRSLKAGD